MGVTGWRAYSIRKVNEDYNSFLKEYNYARDRVDIIKTLRAHSEYLDGLAEDGIVGCYLYDIDWLRIANAGTNPFLIIILIFVASGLFADEYRQEGLINIIRTTKKGRKSLFAAKIVFSAIAVLILSLTITALEGFLILKNLELPDASFPLASLEIFGPSALDVSIAGYFVIAFGVRFLLLEAVCIASTSLGALMKNKLYTLAISFILVFAPQMISGPDGMRYIVGFITATVTACVAITAVSWIKYCKNDGTKFSALKEK